MDRNFDSLALRLEDKIYGTDKGYIRFELLKEDILDFCPDLREGKWRVLDAGGGTGRFARFCAAFGNEVLHCDISGTMLARAKEENKAAGLDMRITLKKSSLMELSPGKEGLFDLVLLHGVAEWMDDPPSAVRHCATLVKPGGLASLLIYNTNKYLLKRGLNGRLLVKDKPNHKHRKLTPTGKMTPDEIEETLKTVRGEIILRSGIRVFNHFLRSIIPLPISRDEWLESERLYYRKEPFASLGEHSHIIWKRT
ncbi:methyltransferase domain-containing protein [Spirochaeta isovalerica]|uniref:S-adenosylmethionine-dependent methyltransferase n=1 Tax=Spirochaeta isovalerica TaxID=150 RepID=A0A841RAP8_9SPIO|nr:methyltransferase domain-containing protein [Spirochaeta isovalerica]MBB6480993.1 S-adenosylmethionine-dependent methyltransferase [Spirochaeta isovalerica]